MPWFRSNYSTAFAGFVVLICLGAFGGFSAYVHCAEIGLISFGLIGAGVGVTVIGIGMLGMIFCCIADDIAVMAYDRRKEFQERIQERLDREAVQRAARMAAPPLLKPGDIPLPPPPPIVAKSIDRPAPDRPDRTDRTGQGGPGLR